MTQCWIILFVGNAFNGVTTNGSQHLEHQQMVHDENDEIEVGFMKEFFLI